MRTTFRVVLAALLVLAALAPLLAPAPRLAAGYHVDVQPQGGVAFLYVYNSSGLNYLEGWVSLISSLSESYTVSLVDYRDFDPSVECSVVVVDPGLEVSGELASAISASGRPVLALGMGGALYLNLTTGAVRTYYYVAAGRMNHWLYVEDGAAPHEVVPPGVEAAVLPLWEGDEVTLVECGFKVFRDDAVGGYGFVSVYGKTAHVALHNATNVYSEREGAGKGCFELLARVADWLARGAPRLRLLVEARDACVHTSVTVNVSVYDNWRVAWCGEEGAVDLTVLRASDNALIHSVRLVGCNVTFTFQLYGPGSYVAVAEREGFKGSALFDVYAPSSVALSNLGYRGGFLLVEVRLDGSPGAWVPVNFSYARGAVPVQDFWSSMDEFELIGVGVSNESGWASVEFNLSEVVTVVAWVDDLCGKRNYTYSVLSPTPPEPPTLPPPTMPPPTLPPPSPAFQVLALYGLAYGFSQLASSGGVGLAYAVIGLLSLLAFRRIGV